MKTLRLAAHIHSEWSDDANWSLSRIRTVLRLLQFDGALMAEHDRGLNEDQRRRHVEACHAASTDSFVFVPGVEYQDSSHRLHVPVYGDIPFYKSGAPVSQILAFSRSEGGFSVLAHPARRNAIAALDPTCFELADGIEVWNRKYDGFRPSMSSLDIATRYSLRPFVSLDLHDWHQLFIGAMVVPVNGGGPERVIEGLRNGGALARVAWWKPERFTEGSLGALSGTSENLRRRASGLRRDAHRLLKH